MQSDTLKATDEYSASRATAPRVSLASMEGKIVAEHYCTAGAALSSLDHPVDPAGPLPILTLCFLVMRNGFSVVGKSAPASAENFDEEKGRRFAYEDAIKQLWPLEGYALRERLSHEAQLLGERVVKERRPEMQTFIGTKVVNAMPMRRDEYNALRGWTLPADEDGSDLGYLVEYTDKADGQVPGFQGYVSWSPAEVFERAYRIIA